jgi:hypothetical protein
VTAPTPSIVHATAGNNPNAAMTAAAAGGVSAAVSAVSSGDPGDGDKCWRPTHDDLRQKGRGDSHHIVQDAAVRDLPGYRRGEAPAILLQGPANTRGTPHYHATQRQRQYGGGTLGKEMRIAAEALIAQA